MSALPCLDMTRTCSFTINCFVTSDILVIVDEMDCGLISSTACWRVLTIAFSPISMFSEILGSMHENLFFSLIFNPFAYVATFADHCVVVVC